MVDRLLRYERLAPDVSDLMDELGLERIGEIFSAEIEMHGYEPPR